MKELFESGLINVRKLASLVWPDKSIDSASSCLHNKVNGINGNSITIDDKRRIKNILKTLIVDKIPNYCNYVENQKTAIYILKFNGTERVYVGASVNPENRFLAHCASMKSGRHHCKELNDLYIKYGQPKMIIIEYSDDLSINEREQYHIYINNSCNKNSKWYLNKITKINEQDV